MVTGNGQLRHALRERSAAAARFPHAYGGLLPARPGTPGIYFEYSRKLVTLVGLVCCFLGAFGAAEYFFVRAGGQGRPLGALLPIFYNRTHPAPGGPPQCLPFTGIAHQNNQTLYGQNNQTVVRFTTTSEAKSDRNRRNRQNTGYFAVFSDFCQILLQKSW